MHWVQLSEERITTTERACECVQVSQQNDTTSMELNYGVGIQTSLTLTSRSNQGPHGNSVYHPGIHCIPRHNIGVASQQTVAGSKTAQL